MKSSVFVVLAVSPMLAGCASTILVGPPDHMIAAQRITVPSVQPGEPTFCIASYEGSLLELDYQYLASRRFRDLRLLTHEHPDGEACEVLLKLRGLKTFSRAAQTIGAYSAFTQDLIWEGSAAPSFFSNDVSGIQLLGPHLRQEFQPGSEGLAKLKASQARGHRPTAEDIEHFAGSGMISENAWRPSLGVSIANVRLGGEMDEDEAAPESAPISVQNLPERPRKSKTESEPVDEQAQADQGAPIAPDVDEPPAAAAAKPHAYAVVIGVSKYRHKLPAADFADADAQSVARYLRALGYQDANIATLINDEASKGDFEKYFERWLPNHADAGSEVFVYYSGHGAPNVKNGDAYLVPYDGDPTYIAETGYPLKKMYEQLAKLPASKITVVMDSCFSGAGGRSVIAAGARPLVTVTQSVIPANITVLAASAGDQISNSYQDKGHGLFTYYFLKGLREKGDDMRAVYEFLKPEVSGYARRELNADQDPQWRQGK